MVGIRHRPEATIFIIAAALLFNCTHIWATEPDGPFSIRADRVESPTGETFLEITLDPFVDGKSARFEYVVPVSFALEARSTPLEGATVIEQPAGQSWKRGELELGDLRAHAPVLLRFAQSRRVETRSDRHEIFEAVLQRWDGAESVTVVELWEVGRQAWLCQFLDDDRDFLAFRYRTFKGLDTGLL